MKTRQTLALFVLLPLVTAAVPSLSAAQSADAKAAEQTAAVKDDYWATHKRPRFYLNWLVFGGVVSEDANNRLTTRDSRYLAGIGGIFRGGAVIRDHHLLGGRFQSIVRPTRSAVPLADAQEDQWGLVLNAYAGPEYRYITDFGLYFGASVGLGVTMAIGDVEDGGCSSSDRCRCCPNEERRRDEERERVHGAVSFGALANVGWEFRLGRYFALYLEVFGGVFHGRDKQDLPMTNGIVGAAFGLGI